MESPWATARVTDPQELAEHRSKEWQTLWAPAAVQPNTLAKLLSQLQAKAKRPQAQLPQITVDDVDQALYTFKDATAQGADRTGPRFYKHLPHAARCCLAGMLNGIEDKGTWPWQLHNTLVVLLGKPSGGFRPIALINFVIRLYFRVRRPHTRA